MMRDFDKKLYPNTYNYVKDNIVEGVRCNRCGADSFDSDLENYEYLTVKTASEVIKYNTQKIMDIITIMSKEEIETEEN